MSDLRPIAVCAGFLFDAVATSISALAIIALTPGLAALGEQEQALFLGTSGGAQALGATWTIGSGFLAAHLAPKREIANAFAVGVLTAILVFLSDLSAPAGVPFLLEAVGLAITIPLALAGGWARAAFRRGPPVG